ncbi:MAG: hypothetical protein CVV27_14385 [Candidatus Melainabacteria bacterium HGW-Melainabacteria-1]|nr:MAG: hypothetical protein CVV27_14385 [Candidatus Melainabacteria bacterium HGW-Melainabacteria-1]
MPSIQQPPAIPMPQPAQPVPQPEPGAKAQLTAESAAQLDVTEASPESSKGLLDYPKDLAMAVTEYASAGQAKNTVEFLEDMGDIKEAAGDLATNLKEGSVLKAAGNAGRIGWNVLSGLGNLFQTGVSTLAGGASTVVSLPLNLLDKGGEIAGKKLSDSDSAVSRAVGQGFKFVSGENSNVSYGEAVRSAAQSATIKALNERD